MRINIFSFSGAVATVVSQGQRHHPSQHLVLCTEITQLTWEEFAQTFFVLVGSGLTGGQRGDCPHQRGFAVFASCSCHTADLERWWNLQTD